MYLKRLYQTNKWWFAVVLLFIVVQLTMDAKQGADISPVYHYGMYSEVILPVKEYTVTEITVNGKKLQTQNFSPYEWDKITLPQQLYSGQKVHNEQVWSNDIKRLLHINDSTKYINTISDVQFNGWYKNYLQTILHQNIDSVSVTETAYGFDGKNLVKKAD